jgi:hypothetical protein
MKILIAFVIAYQFGIEELLAGREVFGLAFFSVGIRVVPSGGMPEMGIKSKQ